MRIRHVHEREFFAHHMLLRVAEKSLEAAVSNPVGRVNACLVTMVFSAFAVEALANAVGSRVVPNWTEYERLKPFEKIDTLVMALSIPLDMRKAPWPALRFLASFRNDIAHPKPEKVVSVKVIPSHAIDKTLLDPPRSTLEREISVGNARRVLAAVQQLKGLLTDALPVTKRDGIYADMSFGRAISADER